MVTFTERLSPVTLLVCALAAISLVVPPDLTSAEKPPAETPAQKQAKIERDRIATAVALNYCKAAFHRIRKNPSKQVMHQEQTEILNNLNLSGIADREVIQLYTAVVDEIHLIQIAEKERLRGPPPS